MNGQLVIELASGGTCSIQIASDVFNRENDAFEIMEDRGVVLVSVIPMGHGWSWQIIISCQTYTIFKKAAVCGVVEQLAERLAQMSYSKEFQWLCNDIIFRLDNFIASSKVEKGRVTRLIHVIKANKEYVLKQDAASLRMIRRLEKVLYQSMFPTN